MKTRIALAQINVTVGDFAGNIAKVVEAARAAYAQLKVFPGLHALVGHPYREPVGEPMNAGSGHGNASRPIERGVPPVDTYNAASLLVDGEIAGTYMKQDLPNTEVFDEKRYPITSRYAESIG